MIVIADRRKVRRGGAAWIVRFPFSHWEVRWKRANCSIVRDK